MNEEEKAIREFRLYELLRRASLNDSILLRENDWEQVEAEFRSLWPDFGQKLYLCGAHLSDIEMRAILKRTKPAISLARSRLYEKLTHTPGTGKMFDEFIRRL